MSFTLYQKFRDIWKNKPDKSTPVTAEAMMHIEQGIYDNSANIINLENKIAGGLNVVDVTFNNVGIGIKSGSGLYYGTVTSLASIGIQSRSVVSLEVLGFQDESSLFVLSLSSNANIIANSNVSMTIGSLTIRVTYIETALSSVSISEKTFSSVPITTQADNGLYYATLTTLKDMGIPENATVIGIFAISWGGMSSLFQFSLSEDESEVLIFSGNAQSSASVGIRVAYFMP